MKKILHSVKTAVFLFAAMLIVLGADVLTAHAQVIFPTDMKETEDGRIEIVGGYPLATDSTGREWHEITYGYPYCYTEETYEEEWKWGIKVVTRYYLDCYLTDYIKSHDESEWPSFVIKGSDGIPFYFSTSALNNHNYDYDGTNKYPRYVKYCYDSASGWWLEDKAYKGPFAYTYTTEYPVEKLVEETKEAIAKGEEVNGTAKDPAPATGKDLAEDTEDRKPDKPENPDTPDTPDKPVDPYADENTLGATVTISTDCIKVKKNNAPQKPLPRSVKIGKKALKRNKTFVVSYEKYENGWNATDAVREEGIYRLVVTGQNGYEGVYKKRLYVTADKTIKAMSSASVKVNKIPYSGSPITSGVIKSVKVGKRTLVEGEDYTVTYMNNLNSGTGQVKLTAVEGSGVLGTKTVNFTISGNKMSGVRVKGLQSLVWNPDIPMEQDVGSLDFVYKNARVYEGTDFTVSYANNTKAGTARIILTGTGLYNGTLTRTFRITKMKLDDSMLDEASKNIKMTRTGKALKPEVSLKHGNTELVKGKDYTLTYSNNVKVSTESKPGKITVRGKGNYTGSFKVCFTINEAEDKGDTATKQSQVKTMNSANDTADAVSENDMTDDTVSENDMTGDTVSENDMTDDTVSENDIIDDSDKADDDQNTDDTDQPDDDQNTDDTDQTGDDQNTDDTDQPDEDQSTDDTDQTGDDQSTDDTDQTGDDQNTDDTDQTGDDQNTDDTDQPDGDQNADDSDQTGEDQNTDDTGKSDGDQNTDDSDKTDEGQSADDGDKPDGDQNADDGDKPDEDQSSILEETDCKAVDSDGEKLYGIRICWCGYAVEISKFDELSEEEKAVWEAHIKHHIDSGENTGYTDKCYDGTEAAYFESE